MIEELIFAQHRILKVAKPWQSMSNEMIQRAQSALSRCGKVETIKSAKMIRKARFNKRKHVFGNRVRFERQRS